VLKKIIIIDVYNITELDLVSEYNIIDLNILGLKSRVRIEVRERKSIKAVSTLYIISQYYSPLFFKGLGN
jgi:hypothetical protein